MLKSLVGEELYVSDWQQRWMQKLLTACSDGLNDTVGSEHGKGGTDDDLHGVVRGVVGRSGTVWAESDKVG